MGWHRGLFLVALIELSIRGFSSIHNLLVGGPLPHYFINSPFAFWFSWSIGAYLCECYIAGRSSRLFSVRFDLMALIVFSLPLFRPTDPFSFLGFSFLTGIAIDRLISGQWTLPEKVLFRTAWSHLKFLGVVSYSFYLFHQPIIELTNTVLSELYPEGYFHPFAIFALCCAWYPVILIFSYILYRSVEQPSKSLGKTVWKKIKKNNPIQALETGKL